VYIDNQQDGETNAATENRPKSQMAIKTRPATRIQDPGKAGKEKTPGEGRKRKPLQRRLEKKKERLGRPRPLRRSEMSCVTLTREKEKEKSHV
jgi:hypothetical protein